MTATGHAIVGAAIATQVTNPLLALPLAFLSHYVCDKLPHWDVMTDDKKPKKLVIIESAIDVFLSVFLVWLIFFYFLKFTDPILIFAGAFMAQLPDWFEVPYNVFKIKLPIIYNKHRIQERVHDIWFDSRMSAPWGMVPQAVVCAVIVWIVAILPR